MIPDTCIEIHTSKFPILDGEDDELVNEGMYGKALCQYLERELPKVGIETPMHCCEDWGWWLEVRFDTLTMGLQIYSDPASEGSPTKYAILPSITSDTQWSWRKFSRIAVGDRVTEVMNRVADVFSNDQEIRGVKRHNDFPF